MREDRHGKRGISLAGRGTGKAAGHRPGLLISVNTYSAGATLKVVRVLLCPVASDNLPAEYPA